MYKQNNRFPHRTEGNRIGKPLTGGKFHASRKPDVHKDDEFEKKTAKADKPVVRHIERVVMFDLTADEGITA